MKIWPVLLVMICCLLAAATTSRLQPYVFRERTLFPPMPEDTSNRVTVEGARLGRYLFYDTLLSYSRHISCASCHRQSAAFSDAPVRFSKGNGAIRTDRNAPGLFNLAWYKALFWDGRAASIEAQVSHPLTATGEMNLQWPVAIARINSSAFYRAQFRMVFGAAGADSALVVKAIGQFLRTLISDRSRYDQVLAGKASLTQEEIDGMELMNDQTKGNCLHCHTTDADALGTTGAFSNIGLEVVTGVYGYKDKGRGAVTGRLADYGAFKIPSLRNVALTAPYMHDGRFASLEAVLDHYSDQLKWTPNIDPQLGFVRRGGAHLTQQEKKKIIAFLQTLTDSALIRDTEYADPFVHTIDGR